MKTHVLTTYGVTLCCLRVDDRIKNPDEPEVCGQCSHVGVMILKGERKFMDAVRERAKTREG